MKELIVKLADSSPPDELLARLPHLKILSANVYIIHASAFYDAVGEHCGKLEGLALQVGFRTAHWLRAMLSALGALRATRINVYVCFAVSTKD